MASEEIQVIDNYLPQQDFLKLQEFFENHLMWQFSPFVTNNPLQGKTPRDDEFQFVHIFYYPNKGVVSQRVDQITPLVNKLVPRILVRIKANLNTRTDHIVQRDWHVDYDLGNKTAIYYVNTNDGYTAFESGEKVESVANRIVIFDGHKRHAGTTCTNHKQRIVLNLNYFPYDQLSWDLEQQEMINHAK